MHLPSDVTDRLFTPRTALYANLALVFTGSFLAMFGMIDLFTGVIIVAIGLAGTAISLVGRSSEADGHEDAESDGS